ncbi:MAG: diaminopimelate epimerase [Polyangiaceae bacterium]
MTLAFHKYEGLGNDFVVIDVGHDGVISPERARELCDRHFGIGADGVLMVTPPSSEGARARMVVLNADGSRPEMCGNGIRCVALHLAIRDGADGISYVVDTDRGPLLCEVERQGEAGSVRVGMGRGRVEEPYEADVDGRRVRFLRVSMGNPHAINFEEPTTAEHADRVGPLVSGAFAEGSNVELAQRTGDDAFEVVVWERGVGRTLACGTGAAATAVAAARAGLARFDAPIQVRLPGGPLELLVASETLEVTMRGPARRVFSGNVGD